MSGGGNWRWGKRRGTCVGRKDKRDVKVGSAERGGSGWRGTGTWWTGCGAENGVGNDFGSDTWFFADGTWHGGNRRDR